MKTTIFFYSGTGNSLSISRRLAKELGDTRVVPLAKFRRGTKPEAERVGVVFPIIAWGPPRTVDEFLQNVDLSDAQYVFAVASCGGTAANTLPKIKKTLKKKGSDLDAGFVVASPGYLETSSNGGKKSPQEQMVDLVRKLSGPRPRTAEERLPEIAGVIRFGKRTRPERPRFLGASLGSFFHDQAVPMLSRSDNGYRVTEACTECQICARVCPRENVVMSAGRPVWNHDCDSCGACATWCPEAAISAVGSLLSTRRHHPEVGVNDFLLR